MSFYRISCRNIYGFSTKKRQSPCPKIPSSVTLFMGFFGICRARPMDLLLGQLPEQLPGAALDPVVQQLPVLAHGPDGRAREGDRPPVGRGAQHAVVPARDAPARGDAAAVLVLEGLQDLELELGDLL